MVQRKFNINGKIVLGMAMLLLVIFALCITAVNREDREAEAANPVFLLNGTYTYVAQTAVGSTSGSGSGSTITYGSESVVEIRIREDNYSGSYSINKGTILSLQKYNIEARAINVKSHKRFVLRKNGTVIANNTLSGSSTILLYSGSLTDGTYDFEYEVEHIQGSTKVTFTYLFDFKADSTGPSTTLKNGNILINSGTRVRGSVTYTASDPSGLMYIYYKNPGDSTYTKTVANYYTIQNGASDGTYYFYAKDKVGNSSSIESVIIDNTSPIGKMYLNDGTLVNSGKVTNKSFKYTATDEGGIQGLYLKRPNGSYGSYTAGTLISGTNGSYNFKAIDSVGNESIESEIYYDNILPIVVIKVGDNIVPNGGVIKATSISASSTDSGSGIEKMEYMPPGSSSYSTYIENTALSGDGKYFFRAIDKAGNTRTANITVDNERPIGTIYLESGSSVSSGCISNKKFKYVATDQNGIQSLYIKRPGGSYESYTPDTLVSGTNGNYSFKAIDNAGNESVESEIYYDTTIPTVTIKAGNEVIESGSITNSPRISASATDTGSGIEKMEYMPPGAYSYSTYIPHTELTEDGKYFFRAIDKAGNTSEVLNVTKDNVLPIGTLKLETGSVVASGYISNKAFKYLATDANGIKNIYIKRPGGSYEDYTQGTLISGINGNYFFKAIDNAGNESIESGIYYDNVLPIGTITLSDETIVSDGESTNKSFKYAATDEGGIKKLQIKRPNSTYEDYIENTLVTRALGTYSFKAEDLAGNISNPIAIYYDPTPPTVTVKVGDLVIENGKSINAEKIYAKASDVGTGIDIVEYIRPGSVVYEEYEINSDLYSEGHYTFRAKDKVGNFSSVVTVTLDRTSPTVIMKSGANIVSSGSIISASTISATSSDAVSGIDKMECLTPGNQSYQPYVAGYELSGEGMYKFRAIDNAGNISSESTVILDTTLPIGKIQLSDETTVPSGAKTNKAFKYTATDTNGIKTIYIKRPNSFFESYIENTLISGTNGIYQFKAIDNALNESETLEIYFDNVLPIITITAGTIVDSGSKVNSPKVFATALDTGSGIEKMEYKSPGATSFSTYISGLELTEEGKYFFKAFDKAGNISQIVDVTLDRTPPTITLKADETPIQSGLITNALKVTVEATDTISGIDKIEYRVLGSSFSIYEAGTEIIEEGSYEFRAIDNAGNISQVVDVTLDRTLPIGTLLLNNESQVDSGYITNKSFKYIATDVNGIKNIFIKRPNSTFELYTSNTLVSGTNGNYIFKAIDNAGNISYESHIYYDTTKPVGEIYLSDGSIVNNGHMTNQTFKYNASDISGIEKLEIKRPSGSYEEYIENTLVTGSTGMYCFRAIDKASNISNERYVFYDDIKPVITIIAGENEVESGAIINTYNFRVNVSDAGTGIETFEYICPGNTEYEPCSTSSYLYLEGHYSFRAIDKAGNISPVVTVTLDKTPPILTLKADSTPIQTGLIINALNIKAEAIDNVSGLERIEYKFSGSDSFMPYTPNTLIAEEGKYEFRGIDNAGNISQKVDVTLDRTLPIGTIYLNTEEAVDGGYITNHSFKYKASDENGIKKIYIKYPDRDYEEYLENTLVSGIDGEYSFKAIDNSGNVSIVKTITLDKTPPTVTVKAGSNTLSNGEVVNSEYITAISTDLLSPEISMFVKTPNTNEYLSYEGGRLTLEGKYYFKAIDKAGNVSNEINITIDRTPPILKIEANGIEVTSKYINQEYLHLFGVDEYSQASVYAKKQGGEFFKVEGIQRYEEGVYRIYVEDDLSNRSEETEITVDYTSPQVSFISTLEGEYISEHGNKKYTSKPFKLYIQDVISPIKDVYMKKSGEEDWVKVSFSSQDNNTNIGYIEINNTTLEDGEYGFYAVDFATNESIKTYITLDRIIPEGEIYYASNYEGATDILLENINLVSAHRIKYVPKEEVLKVEVQLPGSSEFTPYTQGSNLYEEGIYTFRCIDFALNKSERLTVWVDRTAEVPEILGLIDNYASDKITLSLRDSSATMYVNDIEVENNISIYTIPYATYYIKTIDLAGNVWDTTITANTKYFDEKYPLKEWYEGTTKDGVFSYSNYENALEHVCNDEFETVILEEWASGSSWNSGIMRDPEDEQNARPGIFYIYKSASDPNTLAAYFTVERLIEVASQYADKKIKKVLYFEKEPATPYPYDDIYITELNPSFVVSSLKIKPYLQYEINGEIFGLSETSLEDEALEEHTNSGDLTEGYVPTEAAVEGYVYSGGFQEQQVYNNGSLEGYAYSEGAQAQTNNSGSFEGYVYSTEERFFEEEGIHTIVIKDLYGNRYSFEVKIVRSCPDIYIKSTLDVITEDDFSGYIKVQDRINTYYFNNFVDLTINESIDADGFLLIKDSNKQVVKAIEKGAPLTIDAVGIYYIQSVNRYFESPETEVQISLNKASIEVRENDTNKNLEVNITKSKDTFAIIKNIKIEKSIDEGYSYLPLIYDDYGKTINYENLKYKFRTSGIYKITVSDPFRHGDGSVTEIYKYTKPVPEGELVGVLDGGITNKKVTFKWNDEAYATIFKSSTPVSTYKEGISIKMDSMNSKNEHEYIKGTEVSEEGIYVISLKDYDGNVVTYSFAIKTTPPKMTLKGVKNGGTTNDPVTISTFDENIIVKATKDGKAFTYNPGVELSSPGRYELLFKDQAGNLTEYNFEIVRETKNNSYIVWIILASIVVILVLISALIARRSATKYTRKHSRKRF